MMPRRALAALLPALVPVLRPARASAPLGLATSTAGGGLATFGAALAEALAAAEPTLPLTPRLTEGSTENVALLRTGATDLALVAGEIATAALAGPDAPRILAALYGTPLLFAVRGDSPLQDILALRGRPVLWGARASNFVVAARQAMGALGLDIESDFVPSFVGRMADAPPLLLEGRVAAIWGGGAGWPAFTAVAAAPGGARFLAPDAAQRARITAAHPGLRPMALPAGSYPGQAAPIASIGPWVYLLARPGLPEETGHRLARALWRVAPDLARRLPQAAETTPAALRDAAPSAAMIHPGAARALAEAG